jgi:hypothetical protein
MEHAIFRRRRKTEVKVKNSMTSTRRKPRLPTVYSAAEISIFCVCLVCVVCLFVRGRRKRKRKRERERKMWGNDAIYATIQPSFFTLRRCGTVPAGGCRDKNIAQSRQRKWIHLHNSEESDKHAF